MRKNYATRLKEGDINSKVGMSKRNIVTKGKQEIGDKEKPKRQTYKGHTFRHTVRSEGTKKGTKVTCK